MSGGRRRTARNGLATFLSVALAAPVVIAMPALRLVRPVGAVAVEQPPAGVGQVAVPDLVGQLGHLEAGDLTSSRRVEQAQLDLRCMRREHGKVRAEPVPGRTERIRRAGSATNCSPGRCARACVA